MEPFVTRIGDVTIERVLPKSDRTTAGAKDFKDVAASPAGLKRGPAALKENEGIPVNEDLQIFIKPPSDSEFEKQLKDGESAGECQLAVLPKPSDASDVSTDGEETDNEESEMEGEELEADEKSKHNSENELKSRIEDPVDEHSLERTENFEMCSEKGEDPMLEGGEESANFNLPIDSRSALPDGELFDSNKRKASDGCSLSPGLGGQKKKKSANDGCDDGENGSSSDSDESQDGDKTMVERKLSNMRRNIREVMSENQLDEETLAAQRQEMERLRRVQEQQRIIREVQRQIAMNRQNNKTQNRVISILQGNSSILKQIPGAGGTGTQVKLPNTVLVKLSSPSSTASTTTTTNTQGNKKQLIEFLRVQKSLSSGRTISQSGVTRTVVGSKPRTAGQVHMMTPSVSIAPVSSSARQQQQDLPTDSDSDDDYESDSEVARAAMRKVAGKAKGKDVVTISSSSDDDCILLSEPSSGDEEPVDDPTNSGMHTNDIYNIPDEQGRVLVNVGHPADEEDIFIAPQIARVIKPHQIGGVRFLFDNVVESVSRFNTSTGFGCILAHSMGLGKTLQVVCFCDVFLRHTSGRTVLCIMPINTLQNWMAEFNMWLPSEPDGSNSALSAHGDVRHRKFPLHVLNDSHKTMASRARVIKDWNKDGGVLLIGYELYRQLSLKRSSKMKKNKRRKSDDFMDGEGAADEKNKALLDDMHIALVKPGPDLVICDEGHRIKNSHASISQALKQIRSKRRVVLTGYPLQNNLLEYWCMVDFVRPNYLGTKTEFCNMFERPIQNGQCIDSTPQDIRLMRYRAHVLHSLLEGFVQRRSHSVLQVSLPQKEEYVLLLRMTQFQRTLYDTFMNEVVRTKAVPNPLKAFAVCCKIWNHPDILYYFLKKRNCGEDVDLDLEETTAAAAAPGTPGTPVGGSASVGSPAKSANVPKKPRGRALKTPQPKKEKKPPAFRQTNSSKKPAATITPNTMNSITDTANNLPATNMPYTSPTNQMQTDMGQQNMHLDMQQQNQNFTMLHQQQSYGGSQYQNMSTSPYHQGSNNTPYNNQNYGQMSNSDGYNASNYGSVEQYNSNGSYDSCINPNNPNSTSGYNSTGNSYYPNNSGNQQTSFGSSVGYSNYQGNNNQSDYHCDAGMNSTSTGYWQGSNYFSQNSQTQQNPNAGDQYYGAANSFNSSENSSYYSNESFGEQMGSGSYSCRNSAIFQSIDSNNSVACSSSQNFIASNSIQNSTSSGTGNIHQNHAPANLDNSAGAHNIKNQNNIASSGNVAPNTPNRFNTKNLELNKPQENSQSEVGAENNSVDTQHGTLNSMYPGQQSQVVTSNNVQQNPGSNQVNNQQTPSGQSKLQQDAINIAAVTSSNINRQHNHENMPQKSMCSIPNTMLSQPPTVSSSGGTHIPINNGSNVPQNALASMGAQHKTLNVNSQHNSVSSMNAQQNTMNTVNSQHNPMNIGAQQNPMNTMNAQQNPMNSMNAQQNPMNSMNSQQNPMNIMNAQQNPMNSMNAQQNTMNPMNSQQNPTNAMNVQQNPTNSMNVQQNPTNTMNAQQNPMNSMNAQQNPMNSMNAQQNPMNTMNAQQNPMNSMNSQQNPMNTMNAQHNPMNINTLQNTMGIANAQQNPTSTTDVQQNPVNTMNTHHNPMSNMSTQQNPMTGMNTKQNIINSQQNSMNACSPQQHAINIMNPQQNQMNVMDSQQNTMNIRNAQQSLMNSQQNLMNGMTVQHNAVNSINAQQNSMNDINVQQNPVNGMNAISAQQNPMDGIVQQNHINEIISQQNSMNSQQNPMNSMSAEKNSLNGMHAQQNSQNDVNIQHNLVNVQQNPVNGINAQQNSANYMNSQQNVMNSITAQQNHMNTHQSSNSVGQQSMTTQQSSLNNMNTQQGMLNSMSSQQGSLSNVNLQHSSSNTVNPQQVSLNTMTPQQGSLNAMNSQQGSLNIMNPQHGSLNAMNPQQGSLNTMNNLHGSLNSMDAQQSTVSNMSVPQNPMNMSMQQYNSMNLTSQQTPVNVSTSQTPVSNLPTQINSMNKLNAQQTAMNSFNGQQNSMNNLNLQQDSMTSLNSQQNPMSNMPQHNSINSMNTHLNHMNNMNVQQTSLSYINPQQNLASHVQQTANSSLDAQQNSVNSINAQQNCTSNIVIQNSLNNFNSQRNSRDVEYNSKNSVNSQQNSMNSQQTSFNNINPQQSPVSMRTQQNSLNTSAQQNPMSGNAQLNLMTANAQQNSMDANVQQNSINSNVQQNLMNNSNAQQIPLNMHVHHNAINGQQNPLNSMNSQIYVNQHPVNSVSASQQPGNLNPQHNLGDGSVNSHQNFQSASLNTPSVSTAENNHQKPLTNSQTGVTNMGNMQHTSVNSSGSDQHSSMISTVSPQMNNLTHDQENMHHFQQNVGSIAKSSQNSGIGTAGNDKAEVLSSISNSSYLDNGQQNSINSLQTLMNNSQNNAVDNQNQLGNIPGIQNGISTSVENQHNMFSGPVNSYSNSFSPFVKESFGTHDQSMTSGNQQCSIPMDSSNQNQGYLGNVKGGDASSNDRISYDQNGQLSSDSKPSLSWDPNKHQYCVTDSRDVTKHEPNIDLDSECKNTATSSMNLSEAEEKLDSVGKSNVVPDFETSSNRLNKDHETKFDISSIKLESNSGVAKIDGNNSTDEEKKNISGLSNEGDKDTSDAQNQANCIDTLKSGCETKEASTGMYFDSSKKSFLPDGKQLVEVGTNPARNNDPGIPYDWATDLLKNYVPGSIESSAKMEVFFCILEESMALGDRLLVFSQSLFTLNLIEDFLQRSNVPGLHEKWARNVNYYRLDGSTSALEREKLINEYNSNPNIHLFLVSTRAGSLGINLVGANRVVVFDASWNPCHDTQAVCRVYRYGQKKPCFVYRLVMDNCLEKKIYDRQINKQGMADRVVDECNPDAHLSIKDVTNLCWDKEEDTEVKDFSKEKDKYIDVVMQKVLDNFSSCLSKEPFQHESLLVDRKEKKLSQAEKRLAKRSYELEKQASINYNRPQYSYYPAGVGNTGVQSGLQIRAIRTDGMPKPIASVRPMQAELNSQLERGQPRSTVTTLNTGRSRWIPAEVWQRQGMSAQEMTLPLDVVIPTNSPDRASIVLKAGQRVMVLKSPKGIYMQLENGKIIAIRTAFKVGGGGKNANAQEKAAMEKEGEIKPSDLKKDFNISSNASSRVNTKVSNVLPFKNNSAITIIPKTATMSPGRSTPNRPANKMITINRQETGLKPWNTSCSNEPQGKMNLLAKQRLMGTKISQQPTGEARPYFHQQQGVRNKKMAIGGSQLTGMAKPFFHQDLQRGKAGGGVGSVNARNHSAPPSNSDDASSGAENMMSGNDDKDDAAAMREVDSEKYQSMDFQETGKYPRISDDVEQDSEMSSEDAMPLGKDDRNFPCTSEEFSSRGRQDEQSSISNFHSLPEKQNWQQGEKPGWQQGEKSGWQQGEKPGWHQEEKPGWPQGGNPGWQQGEKSGWQQGEKPGWQQGEKPGWQQEEKPGWQQGEKPGWQQGKKPGWQHGEKSGWQQGEKPSWQQGEKPSWQQGEKPGWQQGEKPGWQQGEKPGWQRGEKPGWQREEKQGWQQEEKPGWQQGEKPGWQQGEKPSWQQGEKQGWQQGEKPGWPPQDKPNWSQGKKPGWPQGNDSLGFNAEGRRHQNEEKNWNKPMQQTTDPVQSFQHVGTKNSFASEKLDWQAKSKSLSLNPNTDKNFVGSNSSDADSKWSSSHGLHPQSDQRNWSNNLHDRKKGGYATDSSVGDSSNEWQTRPPGPPGSYANDGRHFTQETVEWKTDSNKRNTKFSVDLGEYAQHSSSQNRNWHDKRNECQNTQDMSVKNLSSGGELTKCSESKNFQFDGKLQKPSNEDHNFSAVNFEGSSSLSTNEMRQSETKSVPSVQTPEKEFFHGSVTTQKMEPVVQSPLLRGRQGNTASLKNYRHATFTQNAHLREEDSCIDNTVVASNSSTNSPTTDHDVRPPSYGNEQYARSPLASHEANKDTTVAPSVSYNYESRVQPDTLIRKVAEPSFNENLKMKHTSKVDSAYDYSPVVNDGGRSGGNIRNPVTQAQQYTNNNTTQLAPTNKKGRGAKSAKQGVRSATNYSVSYDAENLTTSVASPVQPKQFQNKSVSSENFSQLTTQTGNPVPERSSPQDPAKSPDTFNSPGYGHHFLRPPGYYGYGQQGTSPAMPFGSSYASGDPVINQHFEKTIHVQERSKVSSESITDDKGKPTEIVCSSRKDSSKGSDVRESKKECKPSQTSAKDDASPGSASGSRSGNNSARSTPALPPSSTADTALSQTSTASPNFSPFSSSAVPGSVSQNPYDSVLSSYPSTSQYSLSGPSAGSAPSPFSTSAGNYATPLRPPPTANAVSPYATPGSYGYSPSTGQYESEYARASMYSAFHRPEPHHFPAPPTDLSSPFLPSANPSPFGLPPHHTAPTFPSNPGANPAPNYYSQNMYAASPYAARPAYGAGDPSYGVPYGTPAAGFSPFLNHLPGSMHQHPYAALPHPSTTAPLSAPTPAAASAPQATERPAQ